MINIKKDIKNLLLFDNNNFKLTLFKNGVHIINYKNIKTFDDEKMIIELDDEYLIINGKNLATKKLISNEILIEGRIISIELR